MQTLGCFASSSSSSSSFFSSLFFSHILKCLLWSVQLTLSLWFVLRFELQGWVDGWKDKSIHRHSFSCIKEFLVLSAKEAIPRVVLPCVALPALKTVYSRIKFWMKTRSWEVGTMDILMKKFNMNTALNIIPIFCHTTPNASYHIWSRKLSRFQSGLNYSPCCLLSSLFKPTTWVGSICIVYSSLQLLVYYTLGGLTDRLLKPNNGFVFAIKKFHFDRFSRVSHTVIFQFLLELLSS